MTQKSLTVRDLPAAPAGKSGWPWTEGTPPAPAGAWPRISIVTPSYNQGDYIEETIRSVLLQGYPDLEYWVMDGGSKDGTVAVLEKYAPFLAGWVSEKDRGQTHAINKGLERASGEVLAYLNSDDTLLPGALQHVGRAFQRPEVMITTGLRKQIDADSRFIRNQLMGLPREEFLRYYCAINQETTFWRRAVLDKVGLFDETFNYTMDYDYWQRVLDAGFTFTLLPHYLGTIRLHDTSKGTTLDHVRDQELSRIYQRYGLAQDEDEARERLTQAVPGWRARRDMAEWLAAKPISNDRAWMIVLLYRLLYTPVIGQAILRPFMAYARMRQRQIAGRAASTRDN
jgi:glycosyltransferase involved in cell wall biosynthesis